VAASAGWAGIILELDITGTTFNDNTTGTVNLTGTQTESYLPPAAGARMLRRLQAVERAANW
jgi:hypothetical protein